MIKLDKRLQAVADLADAGNIAADICCDHGRLSVWLLQNGRAAHIYAVDISHPSLRKAENLASLCGLGDKLIAICGDGLVPLPCTADIAVIAGVGGKKIMEILSDPRRTDGTKNFVLQPMRNSRELLEYLEAANYKVTEKITVTDRKKYDIIKCSQNIIDTGTEKLNDK